MFYFDKVLCLHARISMVYARGCDLRTGMTACS